MRRADSLEKTLMLGKIEGKRRRGQQRMRWLDGITDSWTWVWAILRRQWRTGKPGMLQVMGHKELDTTWQLNNLVQSLSHFQLFVTTRTVACQLCTRDFPGKNKGVDCHFLLQGMFPTQGLNSLLLHWQRGSLPQNHQGSPVYWLGENKYPSLLPIGIRPKMDVSALNWSYVESNISLLYVWFSKSNLIPLSILYIYI